MLHSVLRGPDGYYVVVPYKQLEPAERSMYRFRKKIRYNISLFERATFATLTYSPQCVNEYGSKDISKFFHDLRIVLKRSGETKTQFSYAWKMEFGSKLKRPHFHAIISRYIPLDMAVKAWGKGFVKLEMILDCEKATNYCTKYLVKPTSGYCKRRFGTSRDLVKPPKSTWNVVETYCNDTIAEEYILKNYSGLGRWLHHER